MTQNPMATAHQRDVERRALGLFERDDVRAAREAARRLMLADPLSATFTGRMGLERALDQWAMALCMRETNGDINYPQFVWNVDNSPRDWFGHAYPGSAVAVDNPDNFNREAPIDGDGRYEIDIQFDANPGSLSVVVELEPPHHAIGTFVAALPALAMQPDKDGKLTVTLDPSEPAGRPHHLQLKPGRLQAFTRDSLSDWRQKPAAISIRRLDPPARGPRTDDEVAAAIIANMTPFVRDWSGFKDTFLGYPEPNRLVGPQGRVGGWGFLAGGRFALAGGEALAVTVSHAGAGYVGFQVTDPWTIAPDPAYRTPSRNKSQVKPNPDGSVTYLLAHTDPGHANWIDVGSLDTGWMLLRWQGVPPDADPASFIKSVDHGPTEAILARQPKGYPTIDLAGRRAEIELRIAQFHVRTKTG